MSVFRSCVLVMLTGCQCFAPVQECVGACGSLEDWCERSEKVRRCDNAKACGLAAADVSCDAVLFWPTFPTWGPACPGPLLDAIDAGRVTFDQPTAEWCLKSLETSCGWHPECERVFEGTLPLGAECRTSSDCAQGGWCDLEMTCPGTCRRKSLAGEVVASPSACGTVTNDWLDDGGFRCRNPSQLGDACGDELQCTYGFRCGRDGGCEETTYTRGAPRGERCTGLFIGVPLTRCLSGLACHVVGDATEGVCGARYQPGEDCQADSTGCVRGAACKSGRCVVLQEHGGACATTFDCKEGLACHAGRCGSRAPARTSCSWSFDCEEPLRCVQGQCATPVCAG